MGCKGHNMSLSRDGEQSSLLAKEEKNLKSLLEAKITKISSRT